MIDKIKKKLRGDKDGIEIILNDLGCTKIKLIDNVNDDKVRFTFGRDEDSSGIANTIYVNTLCYKSFSNNIRGDVITMVSDFLSLNIGDSIKWLAKQLKLSWEFKDKEVNLPFGGFFKNYEKVKTYNYYEIPTYSTDIVDSYRDNGLSLYWIKDNISAKTQEYFNIGYDIWTERITIPWYNELGECIGIQGRLDRDKLEDWEKRYMPIITFNKGNALYGLSVNYKDIQNKGEIIIVEGEKSVLKAKEMGLNNVVAVGCKNISDIQLKLIKSLAVDVIIALDSDVTYEELIIQAKKCKIENPFFNNNIRILDMDNLGEKVSIFDLNKSIVYEAFENRLIEIE